MSTLKLRLALAHLERAERAVQEARAHLSQCGVGVLGMRGDLLQVTVEIRAVLKECRGCLGPDDEEEAGS